MLLINETNFTKIILYEYINFLSNKVCSYISCSSIIYQRMRTLITTLITPKRNYLLHNASSPTRRLRNFPVLIPFARTSLFRWLFTL